MSNISIRGLAVGYDGKPVAEDIDLELEGGAIAVLAGPNGCGKSTVVKTIACQLSPIKGSIELDGKDLNLLPVCQRARKIAYVPQTMDLAHQLTVEELAMLGRNPYQSWWSWSRSSKDLEAVEKALELTELLPLRKRFFNNLSGGERQRAIIATALSQSPDFMLLDEPVNHLDFKHQLQIVQLIEQLREEGIGFLVVLHDLNLIWKLADQVLLLKCTEAGPTALLASGSPHDVLAPENIAKAFGVRISEHTLGSESERCFHLVDVFEPS